jgi:hypothetical protein
MQPALRVIQQSEIVADPGTWVLTEEQVPESSKHDNLSDDVKHVLLYRAKQAGWNVKIGRNLALRWDPEHPQYGVDPDVYMVGPPPPEGEEVMSLRLWVPGHVPPQLAVEIVSPSHPTKDYVKAPEKYAASGTKELWILDPGLEGPAKTGGPYRIQVWRRLDDAAFAQVYAGEGPAWSEAVQGWVHFIPERAWYALSTDKAGLDRWPTGEEAERAAREAAQRKVEAAQRKAEAAQRQAEEERNARELAERRVRELEALLARKR